jgi:hypothetical protein
VEPFELPEDLSALSDEDLAALLVDAVQAFEDTREGDLTPEALEALASLAEAIEAIRAEDTARTERAEQAQAAAEALAERVRAATAQDEGGEGETEDVPDENGGEDTAPAEEPAPETQPGETPAPEPPAPTAEEAPAPQAVAASARRGPVMRRIRERQPVVEVPNNRVSITASADIPGVPMGTRFNDMTEVAHALHAAARTLPASHGNGREVPVATFNHPYGDLPSAEPDSVESAQAAITAATSLDRITDANGALTAAGGWCAPSETIYSLFGVECVGDMLDLPTINVTRGGIRVPVSPSMGDVFGSPNDVAWVWTEANDVSALDGDPTKPCFRIPCPTWNDIRLACTGVCLTHGNLANSAYPEMTERFIALVNASHARFINKGIIAAVETGSTARTLGAGILGATAPVLEAVDLGAIAYREKWGMCRTDILEAVFPSWIMGAMRSDLAQRCNTPLYDVSDAMVQGWLTDRRVRAQFVSDWQAIAGTATDWPATVKFLLYAAGTWVRGNGPTINLGVVRDSTLNETNDYTALWTEECFLLAKQGHESQVITVAIAPNGEASACADGSA